MVTYKTRIYYEKDSPNLGAEVKIFSDAGENIDNILITSESKFKELADKILDIDNTYIDKTELINIVANTQSELQINATKLDGYGPNDFARTIHSHTGYAQTNHASSQATYGLGTTGVYGHNKVINNLTSTEFRNGESLSAYQGKLLNDLISSSKAEVTKWEQITLSGYNDIANYCKLYVNKSLKLARLTYSRTGVKKGVGSTKDSTGKDKNPSPYWIVGEVTKGTVYLHMNGAIPSDYRPTERVMSPSGAGGYVYYILENGGIGIHNVNGANSKSGSGIDIEMNFLYYYGN